VPTQAASDALKIPVYTTRGGHNFRRHQPAIGAAASLSQGRTGWGDESWRPEVCASLVEEQKESMRRRRPCSIDKRWGLYRAFRGQTRLAESVFPFWAANYTLLEYGTGARHVGASA